MQGISIVCDCVYIANSLSLIWILPGHGKLKNCQFNFIYIAFAHKTEITPQCIIHQLFTIARTLMTYHDNHRMNLSRSSSGSYTCNLFLYQQQLYASIQFT